MQRSENGKIISQNPDHEMLFPLSQQYGSAAAELVLIKKKELDRPDGATPRTVSALEAWAAFPC